MPSFFSFFSHKTLGIYVYDWFCYLLLKLSQQPPVSNRRKSLAEVIPDWPTLKPFRRPKKVSISAIRISSIKVIVIPQAFESMYWLNGWRMILKSFFFSVLILTKEPLSTILLHINHKHFSLNWGAFEVFETFKIIYRVCVCTL